jgi:putative IMPACT (imprinted ancient) family translation regulator
MKEIEDYCTIDSVYEDEMNLKGSRFIGIVMPCPDETYIQSNLSVVSKRYTNATHYCYGAINNGSARKER